MRSWVGAGCLLAILLFPIACGGGGGGGSSDPSLGSVRVFLTDAPVGTLDNFVLTTSQIALVSQGGGTVSISSGSVEVDVLDLVMIQSLLAAASVPPGTYTGVVLSVEGISAEAGGVAQTINLVGGAFPAAFQIVLAQNGISTEISLSQLAATLSGLPGGASVKVEGTLSNPTTLAASEIVLVIP